MYVGNNFNFVNCTKLDVMKIFLKVFIVLFLSQFSFANGVVIVDEEEGVYLTLTGTQIDVNVQNQIGTIITSQVFINDLGLGSQVIKYGFPVPNGASVTQLRWKINNGDWEIAIFEVGGDPGGGGNNNMHPNLVNYLGSSPLFFLFNDEIEENSVIEVELTYVELLSYSFNNVTFEYPSDYSLIQSGIIVNSQNFDFNLFSDRTIDNIELLNNVGTISNDGNVATVTINVNESTSINDILIIYELASDELGVIPFSTFLEEGVNECDNFGNGFFGLVVEPESNANTEVIDKNFILVVDKSGSMTGNKIEQAKDAAYFIVNNLNFGDYFNIVDFSSDVDSFSPSLVEYTVENRNNALTYVNNISAGGGTNISESLVVSINQFDAISEDSANIIVFFTDGQATSGQTNTSAILDIVQSTILANETEIFLFTFGIGENVTTDLLTLLAVQNNGFVTFLGDDEITDVISNFYLTIRNPVLLNPIITVEPIGAINNVYPDPLPNLYKGQQLIFTGRYTVPQDISLTLTGTAFNQNVEYSYDFNLSDQNNEGYAFLPKLWAKNKLESLLIDYYSFPEGSPEAEEILAIIEETSICYQVLSPFTSLGDGGTLGIEEFMENESNALKFFPNPFSDETKAFVNLKEANEILVNIYSIGGKLVKTIRIDGVVGNNIITWNGNDGSGVNLKSGIYIYTISIGDKKTYFGKLIKN